MERRVFALCALLVLAAAATAGERSAPTLPVYCHGSRLPCVATRFPDGRWYVPLAPLAQALPCTVTEDRAANRVYVRQIGSQEPADGPPPPPVPPTPDRPALYVDGRCVGQAYASGGVPLMVPAVELCGAVAYGAYANERAGKFMVGNTTEALTSAPGDFLWESYAGWCAVRNGRGLVDYREPTILSRAYTGQFSAEIRVRKGFFRTRAPRLAATFLITAYDRRGYVILRDTACLHAVSPGGGVYALLGPLTKIRVPDLLTCQITFGSAREERSPRAAAASRPKFGPPTAARPASCSSRPTA
jgi:hypothetical protein